jgi:hypothetical protein
MSDSREFPGGMPLLTRKDAVKFIQDELGIPVKKSTFDKKRMYGEGPKPAGYYGRTELFTRPDVMEWALRLFSDKPTKLNAA